MSVIRQWFDRLLGRQKTTSIIILGLLVVFIPLAVGTGWHSVETTAALLLFILVSALLIRRTLKPLHAIADGAEKVGAGELSHRVPVSGTREVRRLATAFNQMARNLQSSESLRAEHGLLRKLQSASLALVGSISPEEVLRISVNAVREITESDVIWILLLDKSNRYLKTQLFLSPKHPPSPEGVHRAPGPTGAERFDVDHRGLLTKTFRDGEPLFLDDLSPFEQLATGDPLLEVAISHLGMTKLNLVPMTLTDRNVGMLVFGKTTGRTPLSIEDKRIILVLAHLTAISWERVRLRAIERESMAESARLSEMKSRILHILSHELKTPLTSLSSSTQLLQETDIYRLDSNTQDRLIGNIARATERLMGIAEEIYPLADILTGTIKMNLATIDCRNIVNRTVEEIAPLTSGKAQTISVSVPASPSTLTADQNRLTQVLTHLLTNASNFSPPESEIEVVLREKAFEVTFEVGDQGIGISEEDQLSIFDGFYQADSELVRRTGGKGLGLLFARTIVELHGGQIWVKSKLGEGSRFYFSIPRQTSLSK